MSHPLRHFQSCTQQWVRALSALTGLALATSSALAQKAPPNFEVSRTSKTGLASMVRAKDGGAIYSVTGRAAAPVDVPKAFLDENGALFGISSPATELFDRKAVVEADGATHTTYRQVYQGVPVYSGIIKIHQDQAGDIKVANGRFYPIRNNLGVVPTIDSITAEQIAANQFPNDLTYAANIELTVVDPGWYGDPPKGARLAYYLTLFSDDMRVEESFFIDAHSGEVLDRWSSRCRLRARVIYDQHEDDQVSTLTAPGNLARSEGQFPVAGPADVNRAYDYYGDTYDYYFRAFGRDSINGAGMPMIATVRSMVPFCPNAFWSGTLNQMVFCDDLVEDDVVAHELTHGVTQFTSGLIYQNQPGQLNEALSDIFGELVDLFNGNAAFPGTPGASPAWPVHPTGGGVDTPNDLRSASCSPAPDYNNGVRWLLGEEVSATNGAIRDMWEPSCFGDPDRANSPLVPCGPFDNGGVHIGSGIVNHTFSMLCDGKTFNGHTVVGIGPIKAAAVFYRAQTTYFTPATDFPDAYAALNQAAQDLIGLIPNDPRTGGPSANAFTAFDAQQVNEALLATEMNTPGLCGGSSANNNGLESSAPPACPNKTTLFFDDFESGAPGWTFSNSAPFNPNAAYNWVLTNTALPLGRSGTVWFCEDRNVGNVNNNARSTHSLTSPPIIFPVGLRYPWIRFTHYFKTQGGFDGGNLKYSVDNVNYFVIPRTVWRFNPPTGRLRSQINSDNPYAGQDSWTGESGIWAESIAVDLSTVIANPNVQRTVRFRFDFGMDFQTGDDGWYIDDFEVYTCPGCNLGSIVPSELNVHYGGSSGILRPIGSAVDASFQLAHPPRAAGDVTVVMAGSHDFAPPNDFISMKLNGTTIRTIFQNAGSCSGLSAPYIDRVTLSANTFNDLIGNGNADFSFAATSDTLDQNACNGDAYICGWVHYDIDPNDCNNNGIPDDVDIANATSIDCNSDCVPDECQAPFLNVNIGPDLDGKPNVAIQLATPTVNFVTAIGPATYQWQITSGPGGGNFNNATLANPVFTPTAEGAYTLRCTVHASFPPTCSHYDELVVYTSILHAVALTDQKTCVSVPSVPLGDEPLVTGGRPPYSYSWTVVSGPSDFVPNPNTANHPALTPPVVQDYELQVEVKDSSTPVQTVTATMKLLVGEAPTLNAGQYKNYHPIITVGDLFKPGAEFTATGGRLPHSYKWSVSTNPDNGGTFTDDTTADPTFIASKPGTYVLSLAVADSVGCNSKINMSLTATADPPMTTGGVSGEQPGGNPTPPSQNGTCGVSAPMCGAGGTGTIVGCLAGFGVMRSRRAGRRSRPIDR